MRSKGLYHGSRFIWWSVSCVICDESFRRTIFSFFFNWYPFSIKRKQGENSKEKVNLFCDTYSQGKCKPIESCRKWTPTPPHSRELVRRYTQTHLLHTTFDTYAHARARSFSLKWLSVAVAVVVVNSYYTKWKLSFKGIICFSLSCSCVVAVSESMTTSW